MNILVIGNGFDLAHGLPTKYTDFLLFCNIILNIIKESHIEHLIPKNDKDYKIWIEKTDEISFVDGDTINRIGIELHSGEITDRDKEICKKMIYNYFLFNFSKEKNNQKIAKELYHLIYNNIWIEYFLQCNMHGKENWIDFESEISDVIQSISNGIDENNPRNMYKNVIRLENNFFNDTFTNYVSEYLQASAEEQEKIRKSPISYKALRDILLADLNRMIRAFEIYLTEYVEKINAKVISPDIQQILPKEYMKVDGRLIYNTMLLSFNYTNTYQRLYMEKVDKNFEKHIDYIHGKADINNTIETNNMVLGIDEYLPEDRKNKDVEFIAFKKFYQRIHKETGCKYKEWVDEIRNNQNASYNQYNLYIFGHSLDVTDKDVLRDLILNDNVNTTIFYHNKDVMGQQIANLVKVIGQDELIRRTGGSTKTIEFKQQQDMITI